MNGFDERVELAIKTLWVDRNISDGRSALTLLESAAADNDGDAYYFLGRCYSGAAFVDPAFGFEENDPLADSYFKKSIQLGSAVGMFATMRVAGFKPPNGTYVHPPYYSMREIWDTVYRMSENGNLFCMYLVGIALYYGDVTEFLGIDPDEMSFEELAPYLRSWIAKSVQLLERCLSNGMTMPLGFLIDIYDKSYPGIPKQPHKVRQLMEIGASRGIGKYESMLGEAFYEEMQFVRADELFKRAISHGYRKKAYLLGTMHTFGGQLELDLNFAKNCFEISVQDGNKQGESLIRIGEIYFYGGPGVWQDYNKAFFYLSKAYEEGYDGGVDLLGTCYLKGLGVNIDYHKAKQLFELRRDKRLCAIGLGEIYAYGLGQVADINAGMAFWNLYMNDPTVLEHKKNFKKTLFGWKPV